MDTPTKIVIFKITKCQVFTTSWWSHQNSVENQWQSNKVELSGTNGVATTFIVVNLLSYLDDEVEINSRMSYVYLKDYDTYWNQS